MKSQGKYIEYVRFLFLTIILLLVTYAGQAQKETEVFIPLGKSPGVSGKYSVIGRIEVVNIQDSTITIAISSGNKTIRITAGTEIYLDKSKLRLTNQKGSWADIKKGFMAEAKYKDNKPNNPCEWIKVQLE